MVELSLLEREYYLCDGDHKYNIQFVEAKHHWQTKYFRTHFHDRIGEIVH